MSFSARIRELPDADTMMASVPDLGAIHYVIIHHLAPGRGRVEAYHGLHVGEQIELDIPGLGKTKADVISQTGDFYECAFLLPFDAEAVRSKQLSSKVVWADFRNRKVHPPVSLQDLLITEEIERYSPLARLTIIGGAAGLMWCGIIAAVWL